MSRSADIVEQLAALPVCGYRRKTVAATEPTALTALALLGHGRKSEATTDLRWLIQHQQDDGFLGVRADSQQSQWPTRLAIRNPLALIDFPHLQSLRAHGINGKVVSTSAGGKKSGRPAQRVAKFCPRSGRRITA
jgi:hypothetical protein